MAATVLQWYWVLAAVEVTAVVVAVVEAVVAVGSLVGVSKTEMSALIVAPLLGSGRSG